MSSVAFNGEGEMLASGSWDNTIRLWSVSERRELAVLAGHADLVNSVAFDKKAMCWPQGVMIGRSGCGR